MQNEKTIFDKKCRDQIVAISKKYNYPSPNVLISATLLLRKITNKDRIKGNFSKEIARNNKDVIVNFKKKNSITSSKDMVSGAIEAEDCVDKFMTFKKNNKNLSTDDILNGKKKWGFKVNTRSLIYLFVFLFFFILVIVFKFLYTSFLSETISAPRQTPTANTMKEKNETQVLATKKRNEIKENKKDNKTKQLKQKPENSPGSIKKDKQAVPNNKENKKHSSVGLSDDVVVYPKMFTGKKISAGGVCIVVPSLYEKDSEYIYYIKGERDYYPVYKKIDWDKSGIKIDKRIVSLSIDNIKKFVEIEKGKYLPLELFSSCSIFDSQ